MKSQVKILFVITQGFWGGAQKYVLDLASSLEKTHEIHIALANTDLHIFESKIQGHKIQLHGLKHLQRDISSIHDILATKELHRLYKDLMPDIVHLNSSKAGILGSLARTKSTKIIYTAHGWVFEEPLSKIRKTIYKKLEQLTAGLKDAVIVLSQNDKTIATDVLKISKQKIFQIPLGIEEIAFLEKNNAREFFLQKNKTLDRDTLWCGTIANHYKTKGLDLLIEAISKLSPTTRTQTQYIIIGDGPERPKLEAKIQEKKLENTIFLIPSIDGASKYLPAFDFFLLPSRKEGLPYTILEALQAGLPIIATNVGGVSTLIKNKENGLLIAKENIQELKQTLETIVLEKNSWIEYSRKNKEESTKYSLLSMIEQTKQLYSSLLIGE